MNKQIHKFISKTGGKRRLHDQCGRFVLPFLATKKKTFGAGSQKSKQT